MNDFESSSHGEPNEREDAAVRHLLSENLPTSVEDQLNNRFDTLCQEIPEIRNRSQVNPPKSIRSAIWAASVAVSLVICVALATFVFRAQDAWAEVVQAVRNRPWMHGVATLPEGQKLEFWLGLPRGIGAWRFDHMVHFVDLPLNERYEFLPVEATLYRLPAGEHHAEAIQEMDALLASFARGDKELKLPNAAAKLVRQQRREVQENGRTWTEFELEIHDSRVSPGKLTMIYRVDPQTGIPTGMKQIRGGQTIQFALDYPGSGPVDVYALGVPRDAKIVDRIPSGDVQRVLAAGKVGRQRIGSYAGIILETMPQQPGKPLDVHGAHRVWRSGNRWRIERAWEDDLSQLRMRLWDKPETVPSDTDLALVWWKEAVQKLRFVPLFVSDGKTAFRIKSRYSDDPQTGRQTFEIEAAEPDYIQLDATDPMPTMLLLPEQMCFPPMGIPNQRFEVTIDPAPRIGPRQTTLITVTDTLKPGPKRVWRYWIDVTHGYAAVRNEMESHGQIQVDVIDALKQSPQGTWYTSQMRRGVVRTAGEELGSMIAKSGEGDSQEVTTSYRWYLLDFDGSLKDELFATPTKIVERVEPVQPKAASPRDSFRFAHGSNQLREVSFALHEYASRSGRFPPATLLGPDGKTPHSWRVAILPYLGYEELHKQYKFDEPWDSPANLQVLEKMPPAFRSEFDGDPKLPRDSKFQTYWLALIGPGTCFDSDHGTALSQISDGPHRTLLVVEASQSVPWTKPDDLTVARFAEGLNAGHFSPEMFLGAFADGTVQFLSTTLSREQRHALATKAGGEKVERP